MIVSDILHWRARHTPGRVAIEFGTQRMTFAELAERMHQCAHMLAEYGIAPGDRVGVLGTNSLPIIETVLACADIGAIAVPLNYRLHGDEIASGVQAAQCALVIVENSYAHTIDGTGVPTIAFTAEPMADSDYHRQLAGRPLDCPKRCPAESAPLFLQFTSGTTGRPKGALTAHRGWVQLCMIENPSKGLTADSVYLAVLPLCHTGGLKWVLGAVFAGARTVLLRNFDPGGFARTIDAEGATNLAMVPTMLRALLSWLDEHDADLTSLRYLNIGGEPLSPELLAAALKRLPVQLTQGFGMTEIAGGSVTFRNMTADVDDLLPSNCVGFPLPDCDVSVLTPSGAEAQTGTVGEIAVKTDRVLIRYWGQEHSPLDGEGRYRTGDLGQFDEQGRLHVVGRQSQMIISGGLNIYPREVELTLERHPSVAEAFVVGRPDEKWGERPRAFVVPARGDLTAATLAEWCRQHLARYKCPDSYELLTADQVPRTALGKVRKDALAELEDQVGCNQG